jgi:hypothetical protein
VEPRQALRDGFSRWLDEYSQDNFALRGNGPLDPWTSSLRNSARTVPWLNLTEQVKPLPVNDATQAVRDMRAASLITGRHPDQRLTELGARVLARWRALGVDDEDPKHEVARCGALFAEAYRLGLAQYHGIYAFWCELIRVRPAEYWWRSMENLYLPSYLDRADSSGYNPFRVLIAAHAVTPEADLLGTARDWEAWAAADGGAGGTLGRLLKKVGSERRGGRQAFCMGLEAYRLAREEPRLLPAKLEEWGIHGA